jgi:type IVB pilus formation R64 PilN family outer membrane protein
MKLTKKLCLALISIACVSCSNTVEVINGDKAKKIETAAKKEIAEAYKLVPKDDPLSNIEYSEDFYIPSLEENEKNRPDWFFEESDFQFKELTLYNFMIQLQREHQVNPRYLDGLDGDKPFSLFHTGPIGYALEKVKLATGFSYTIDDDVVTWSQYETAYIDISFIPGISNFRIGSQANAGSSSSDRYDSSSIDTVVTDAGVEDDTNYLNLEGEKLDSLADITKTIELLKSPKGEFNIQASSSTLYVRDLPENVKRIKEAIRAENRKATAQVFFDIKIIDYENSDGGEYGLNWDLISTNLSEAGVVSLSTDFSGSLMDGTAAVLGYSKSSGKYAGSSAFVDALDEQGIVYNVIEPKVTLRNNRIGKVIDGSDTTYLASSGSSSTTTSSTDILIPGIVASGLNLYAVANINLDDMSIVGAIANKYASLVDIGTVTSDDALIQTPETTRKEFHQEFYVKDGETIMLSGLTTRRSEYSSSVAGSMLFGGTKGSVDSYANTIILLTPRILLR